MTKTVAIDLDRAKVYRKGQLKQYIGVKFLTPGYHANRGAGFRIKHADTGPILFW